MHRSPDHERHGTEADPARRCALCCGRGRDAAGKKALDAGISCGYETKLVKKLAAVTERIDTRVDALDSVTARLKTLSDVTEEADFIRDDLLSRMTELRPRPTKRRS